VASKSLTEKFRSTISAIKEAGFIEEANIKKLEDQIVSNAKWREQADKEVQKWLSDYFTSASSRLSNFFMINTVLLIAGVLLQQFAM
jgi:hypothetical protein